MTENGFEYVDLGLPSKTMWATCNVGADKPEDNGLLFQFGHIDGYKYMDENHKFKTNAQNLEDGSAREYIPITSSGRVYKKNEILDLDDDTAHIHMGGKWRMPTYEQLKELYDNTTHRVETINGVQCMAFTSKINNKQLFIPFAGCWYNGVFGLAEACSYIWSSQVHDSYGYFAYILRCESNGKTKVDYYFHSGAFSVRGVFKK